MAQDTHEILDHTRIIEAITNPFVQIEFQIHILSLHDFAVFDFLCTALPSEGAEHGDRAEVIR